MEAISRGAAEAGCHVIGVTCDEIESWRSVKPNRWVKEEKRSPTLRKRLFELIDSCDGALALPGGIGTLAEIVMMWAQLQVQPGQSKPLILIGPGWDETIKIFISQLGEYVPAADQTRISTVPDVESAISALQKILPL
jgi:predicted Rossmann-fold nucleotide-binding protein